MVRVCALTVYSPTWTFLLGMVDVLRRMNGMAFHRDEFDHEAPIPWRFSMWKSSSSPTKISFIAEFPSPLGHWRAQNLDWARVWILFCPKIGATGAATDRSFFSRGVQRGLVPSGSSFFLSHQLSAISYQPFHLGWVRKGSRCSIRLNVPGLTAGIHYKPSNNASSRPVAKQL